MFYKITNYGRNKRYIFSIVIINHFIRGVKNSKFTPMDDITIDDDLGQGESSDGLTTSMKSNLKEGFNWMRITAIIQMVVLALAVLGMLFVVANAQGGFGRTSSAPVFLVFLLLIGVFFLVFTLYKAGDAYKRYSLNGNVKELETAFLKQKQYWTVLGILSIIGIFIYAIRFLQLIGGGY